MKFEKNLEKEELLPMLLNIQKLKKNQQLWKNQNEPYWNKEMNGQRLCQAKGQKRKLKLKKIKLFMIIFVQWNFLLIRDLALFFKL